MEIIAEHKRHYSYVMLLDKSPAIISFYYSHNGNSESFS